MTTLFINTEDQTVLKAVKALLTGFKVTFEEASDKEYDPEFVSMVQEGEKQIKAGKTVKLKEGESIWNLVSSK
ncbi:DUF2683 family protein [Dyadobacter psychrophilus]|uniref:Uncharacterized protein n=1 Tax=Dyadobacter psychrophilus TaxID=651661 RepID=A0A1T5FE40_9BACT|nr:DUF2683 family protein [Dyadobacter psychrophilus]SKB94440.1 hypothetical protein SAMN05660293_03095 [Dyadobacter psychrophilus]